MKPKSAASERRRRASREEIDFTEAMERYRQENRRPFPTWSEVLEVVRSLGYRKGTGATAKEANGGWRAMCADLKDERDRLHLELLKLRDDYKQVCTAVGILMQEDSDVDIDELLAQSGKGPSMEEFLAELKAEFALR